MEIHLKMLSAKWRPFYPGGDELMVTTHVLLLHTGTSSLPSWISTSGTDHNVTIHGRTVISFFKQFHGGLFWTSRQRVAIFAIAEECPEIHTLLECTSALCSGGGQRKHHYVGKKYKFLYTTCTEICKQFKECMMTYYKFAGCAFMVTKEVFYHSNRDEFTMYGWLNDGKLVCYAN